RCVPAAAVRSCLQPHHLVLCLGGGRVASVGLLVAAAAHPLDNHCEGTAIPRRRAIWVGAMDGLAMMDGDVAGPQADLHLADLVVGAIVGDALRKAKDVGAVVRADAAAVRAGDVAQTTVLLVDGVQ